MAETSVSSGLESLSAQDRFLVEKTEEALRDGKQLEQWCRQREQERSLDLFPLDLKRKFQLPHRAEGFFGSLEINGKGRSVMGCRQEIEMGRLTGANTAARVQDFVLGKFLNVASWSDASGAGGGTHKRANAHGFSIEQSLYRTPEGLYGKVPQEQQNGGVDWRHLGKKYEWVFLTVQIHDFILDPGLFRNLLKEAACVVAHSDFVHVAENPSKDYILEVSIGYPFVDFAPIPNFFGFGPGKFGTAVKLFSFFLTPENDVRARLIFAAAPRSQKVFDFGKRWPDPVYGGAKLLHGLTLGLWDQQAVHNKMDKQMLVQHCCVHQFLMDGRRDWDTSGRLAALQDPGSAPATDADATRTVPR
jgi:hypothetical protein